MSTIVTDTLQGKTSATSITLPTTTNIGSTPLVSASANSMTIRGEGSAVTNIQQGLAKAWVNFNGTSTIATRDSFNTGSLTDNATGDYTIAYSNTMANVNYATVSSVLDTSTNAMAQLAGAGDFSNGTSSFRTANVRNTGNSSVDPEHLMLAMHGDLA